VNTYFPAEANPAKSPHSLLPNAHIEESWGNCSLNPVTRPEPRDSRVRHQFGSSFAQLIRIVHVFQMGNPFFNGRRDKELIQLLIAQRLL
jgi:hypothetical protein